MVPGPCHRAYGWLSMHPDSDAVRAEAIRRSAYFFWEQDERPEGSADRYWTMAEEAHRRQADYDRWLAESAASDAETIKSTP